MPKHSPSSRCSTSPATGSYDGTGEGSHSPNFPSSSNSYSNDAVPQETIFSQQSFNTVNFPSYFVKTELTIIEEPIDKCRFRYEVEFDKGSHGCLAGKSTGGTNKRSDKTFPTVKLQNYIGSKPVIIRASLFRDTNDMKHVHKLRGRNYFNEDGDWEIKLEEDMTAVFSNISIEFTKKGEAERLLIARRQKIYQRNLTAAEKKEVKNELKQINFDCVRLGFQAFTQDSGKPLCPIVFSHPISNSNSSASGELKICRISKFSGDCNGNEEVFLLCEKVKKDEVKVQFYELNDNEEIDWTADGVFNPVADVHHQVAIVFQTPPYRKTDIEEPVDVCMRLYRAKDGAVSEPCKFRYYRNDTERSFRKRRREDFMEDQLAAEAIQTPQINENALNLECGYLSSTIEQVQEQLIPSLIQIPEELQTPNYSPAYFNDLFNESLFSEISDPDMQFDAVPCQSEIVDEMAPMHMDDGSDDVKFYLTSSVDERYIERVFSYLPSLLQNAENVEQKLTKLVDVVNENGNNIFHTAVSSPGNNSDIVYHLVSLIPRSVNVVGTPNYRNLTPIHMAIILKKQKILRILLTRNAQQKKHFVRDHEGNTAVHIAAEYNSELCLKDVINVFPEAIDLTNNEGSAPLHIAVVKDFVNVGKILFTTLPKSVIDRSMCDKDGADVNKGHETSGRTALHLAVDRNLVKWVELLLSHPKIEVDTKDYSGNTALHLAYASGNSTIVKMLIQAKADPYLQSGVQCNSDNDIDFVDEFSKVSLKEEDNEVEKDKKNAFDFAFGNGEILKILTGEENKGDIVLCTDNSGKLLDAVREKKFCVLLDPPNTGWKELGMYFGWEEDRLKSLPVLCDSPTKSLLDKFQKEDGTIEKLKNILKLCMMEEALQIVYSSS